MNLKRLKQMRQEYRVAVACQQQHLQHINHDVINLGTAHRNLSETYDHQLLAMC